VRTIAIVNQKGGCGKTSTAINLAAVFAHRGLRTLLVDMDPQAHCAIGLGVPERGIEQSVAEALLKADRADFDPPSAVWEVGGNLDLLPSTMRLAGLEAPGGGLHELADRDRRLTHLVGRFAGCYDRCLIDCPPTIGLLTFNALRAAREALIPVETGFFALRGADMQWRTIRKLIERIGRPIACHLLPTLYNADSALAGDILAALRRQFAGQVIPMVVNEDEVVREAASFGQPVIEYAPQSRAREDFDKLADWLEDHPAQSEVRIEVMQGPGQPAPRDGDGPAVPGISGLPAVSGTSTPHGRAAELAQRVRDLHSRLQGGQLAPAGDDPGPGPGPGPQPEPGPRPLPTPAAPVEVAQGPVPHGQPPAQPRVPERDTAGTGELSPRYGAATTGRGVRFVQPGDGRQAVAVAGDFNHWSPTATPLPFDARLGAHQAFLEIPPGQYRYRLIVDGHWQADPYNDHRQVNEYDEMNSVLVVPGVQDPS
jgi:chromosome partitioning protein